MKKTYYKGSFEDGYIPVPESGCWLWIENYSTEHAQLGAYGTYKSDLAHRYSYKLHKGDIPRGTVVRHTCDVRECVNPEHLILGSQFDNYMDMVKRRRLTITPIKKCDTFEETVAKHGYSIYSEQNIKRMPAWMRMKISDEEQEHIARWKKKNKGIKGAIIPPFVPLRWIKL